MAPDSALWYVMINDAETGPLTRVELGVELATGAISSDSLVWKEGMINWLPGARVPELQALFKNPPRSPRAAPGRSRPPPPPPQKGMGLSDFDTAHFKLADLAPEDGGAQRQMEFDTAHFKLADVANESGAAQRQMEFDTSHFRLQDLKGVQGARALVPKRIVPRGMEPPPEVEIPRAAPGKAGPRSSLKQASTAAAKPLAAAPVAMRQMPPPPVTPKPAPAKAAPRPAPKPASVASDFDPNRTSVDFRTLGELVHQQDVAQSLFESEIVPDEAPVVDEPAAPSPDVEELSKWAAAEVESGEQEALPAAPKKKLPPPPTGDLDLAAQRKAKALAKSAHASSRNWVPMAIGFALALVGVLALLRFLLG